MRTNFDIPKELEARVTDELEAGERIVWIDMPIPRFFTSYSTSAFGFGIFIAAFVLLIITSMVEDTSEILSWQSLWLIPVIALPASVGLFLLYNPISAYLGASKTVYAISNKRAIVLDEDQSSDICSYRPAELQSVYRTEKRDGSGDVIILHEVHVDSEGHHEIKKLGFLNVRNSKEVEYMLKQLAEEVP